MNLSKVKQSKMRNEMCEINNHHALRVTSHALRPSSRYALRVTCYDLPLHQTTTIIHQNDQFT
jgi:hypothetical protein